jgi:hypothetical protein
MIVVEVDCTTLFNTFNIVASMGPVRSAIGDDALLS